MITLPTTNSLISRRTFMKAATALALATYIRPVSPAWGVVSSEDHVAAMGAYAQVLTNLMDEQTQSMRYEFQLLQLDAASVPALTTTLFINGGGPRSVQLYFYANGTAELIAQAGGSSGWLTYLPETGYVCCGGNHSSASWDSLYRIGDGQASCIASMSGGYEGPDFFTAAPSSATYTAHGNETDAASYIAAVQEAMGFEPSLLFGQHIDSIDPYNNWIPMGARDPYNPTYALTAENIELILGSSAHIKMGGAVPVEDSDEPSWAPLEDPALIHAYAAYHAKLQEYISQYGEPRIVEINHPAGCIAGCAFAGIVPLGGTSCTGSQLVVACQTDMQNSQPQYTVDIWDLVDNETALIWQGHAFPGHQGYEWYLAFDEKDGQVFSATILFGMTTLGADHYRVLDDGSFGPVATNSFTQDDGRGGENFFVDGQPATYQEFQASYYDARDLIPLSLNGGNEVGSDHHQQLLATANTVAKTLDLLRLGAEGWDVHFPSVIALSVEKALALPYPPSQPLTFPITEDPADPTSSTYIRSAIWCDSAHGRCLSFLTYAGTELFAYPSINTHNYLSFRFYTPGRIQVYRTVEPTYLDDQTPSYWHGDDGIWY